MIPPDFVNHTFLVHNGKLFLKVFVTEDMVKEGAVVIDVGINRVDDASRERGYRLTGDVDFSNVTKKASHITPVPGGVGPMTIAYLLKNTMIAARKRL